MATQSSGAPKLSQVLWAFTAGFIGLVVVAYLRIDDVQRAVHSVALAIEDRYFGGDVAGATNGED